MLFVEVLMKPVYKSQEIKNQVHALYEKLQQKIPLNVDERMVQTSFGKTHVLEFGDPKAPPLVVFHGGNVFNTADTSQVVPLASKFRIIAPDTIGHPGKSTETRLDASDLSYGRWAHEVVTGMGIARARFMGPSYGGGILLHLAAHNPELIERAAFFVPTGFVRASMFDNLVKFGPALIKFLIKRSDNNIRDILRPLFPHAERLTKDEMAMFRLIFTGINLSTSMPRVIKKDELTNFTAPVLIIAGEKDVMCPAARVLKRASEVLPNLKKGVMLKGAPHMSHYYPEWHKQIMAELESFL